MTYDQIIADLLEKFPDSKAYIENWHETYRKVIGHGGPEAGDGYQACLLNWVKLTPPKPADIRRHLKTGAHSTAAHAGDFNFQTYYNSRWRWEDVPSGDPLYGPAKRRVWIGQGPEPTD